MYREAMKPDIPTELGERLPRKEELPKEQKYEKVAEHIVKVNGKYRTVDYPTPP